MTDIQFENPHDSVALLTGGGDKHYALGLASALTDRGLFVDFIGSDDLDSPELQQNPRVHFLNLRGDQSPEVSFSRKCFRILAYYAKLIRYAAGAEPKVFHILWNSRLEFLDRILLLYYKLLGKKTVFTAHNVNIRKRDGSDTWLHRLALRFQYRLLDGIFVHTEKMRDQLIEEFNVLPERITVIPYGINANVPDTPLTAEEARSRLGLHRDNRVLLFFGHIAPYKGLEYLADSLATLVSNDRSYRLIIAGKPKNCAPYWGRIKRRIAMKGLRGYVIENTGHIPDEEIEAYFKAADVLILPYTYIFQSGVLFLSYYFGLPAIAADVGSLRKDIVEGETGYIFRARDSDHLASVIETYFQSDLYRELARLRPSIRQHASQQHSWTKVGELTHAVYGMLNPTHGGAENGAVEGIVNDP